MTAPDWAPTLVTRPGGVEVGTVNGLPCVRAVEAVLYGPEWEEIPCYSGSWMAGLPEWWPRRPTQQCVVCGVEKNEGKLGHVCDSVPADPSMVDVFASVEAFTSPGRVPRG